MSILLLVSLMALAAALAASIVLFARTGEVRVGLLAAFLGAVGIPQALALWQMGWGVPAGIDLPTASAAAGLLASLLGLMTVFTVGRTLHELERAETLHWESMEGVRGVTELASRRNMTVEEKLPLLLEMGCERLGLDIGLVCRVRGDRYELLALHAPEDFPVSEGAAFALSDTACRHTLESERPVARARADEGSSSEAARDALPFEAYLGACVRAGDEPFGTLAFASLERRVERFSASHKDLVALMAQWIGAELEREQLAATRRSAPAPTHARSGSGSGSGPASQGRRIAPKRPVAAGGVVLNDLVERLEKRIRRTAGSRVEVVFELAPELEPAAEARIPLEAIVLTLVRKAADSLPDGGELVLATANHEFAREPGVLPAREPDRYVTLSISETSGRVDADAFSRVFEAEAPPVDGRTLAHPEARIALPTIYRMLQRVGGDLSVEVEPGRGSTFTLFLPREKRSAPAAAEQQPGLASAAAPPVGH